MASGEGTEAGRQAAYCKQIEMAYTQTASDLEGRQMENLSAIGLLYDGVGVFVLGIPAFFRAPKAIMSEASTMWNFNTNQVRSMAAGRTDIATGSGLLLLGFALQFLSSAQIEVAEPTGVIATIALPVGVIAYYAMIRPALISRITSEVFALYDERRKQKDADQRAGTIADS